MKTLGRILIILMAALGVIGATYALSQTTMFSALIGQSMGQSEAENRSGPPSSTTAVNDQSFAMTGRPTGGAEDHGGSWETVERNLLQIAAIIAAVQVVWVIGRRIKRTVAKNNRLQWSRR